MIQVEPGLHSDNVETFEEAFKRSEQTFFAELVAAGPGPYADIQREANAIDGLLPRERFYVRFVESNFDGEEMQRWVWLVKKPANRKHPDRVVSVLVCETPSGEAVAPCRAHVEALSFSVAMWRGGLKAAVERKAKIDGERKAVLKRDHDNNAEAFALDTWRAFCRTFEDVSGSRAEGSGPNRGGRYYGRVMNRDYTQTSGGVLVPR